MTNGTAPQGRRFRPASQPAFLAAIYLVIACGADWIHGRSGTSNAWGFPAQLLTKGPNADPNEPPLGVLLVALAIFALILAYLPRGTRPGTGAAGAASAMLGAAGMLLAAAFVMQADYGVRLLADGRDFFDVAGIGFYALVGGSGGMIMRPIDGHRAGRAISYLVISFALFGGALLVMTQDAAARPDVQPTSPVQQTRTGTPTPVPDLSSYEVTARPCIRLRRGPSLGATEISCIVTGDLVLSDGDREIAEGYEWLHVQHPQAGWGWTASIRLSDDRVYLRRIPTD